MKTFVLPHGRGTVTVPTMTPAGRDVAMRKTAVANGYPFEPTGDPMEDGVGPASWAPRRDVPELDGHGHPKIVPIGRQARLPRQRGPRPAGAGGARRRRGRVAGTVTDMWIDAPEQHVRYIEMQVPEGSKHLIPIQLARIFETEVEGEGASQEALRAHSADQVRQPGDVAGGGQDLGFSWGGGKLYAAMDRQEPQLG